MFGQRGDKAKWGKVDVDEAGASKKILLVWVI
jgi:hypothetical protein